MTTAARPAGEADAAPPRNESHWALIRRKFNRHRLAVAGLVALGWFYSGAVLAEFAAPYPSGWKSLGHIYCPPQLPKFSFEHGLHVSALRRQVDPVTLRNGYVSDGHTVVPLGLFVEGEPYLLAGILPARTHLVGVDLSRLDRAALPEGFEPTFFFLGADKFGRDILSRLIFGARISLSVGLASVFFTLLLGVILGGISGYAGGQIDNLIQRCIEIVNSFPHLPLWLALAALFPPDWPTLRTYFAITIVLSLLNWTSLARVVRGKILMLREEDYAVAARLLGASRSRILFRHLLPGFTSHIIVTLTLTIPTMILGETALSFLGVGLRPPVVSWGVMLQDCLSLQVVANYPWLLLPVAAIVITVLSFNFVGDGLRDAADPYASP